MKTLNNIISLFAICLGIQMQAQQTPAPAQSTSISVVGATVHIGDGTLLENATLVFKDGVITALGTAGTPTQGTVIQATGKHIYPSFIAPCSELGLIEVDAVRPTNDTDELGTFIPNVRSLIAYNAESQVVESMRPNGVLLAQVAPQGGRISGTSSVVQLDAWNWEDAAVLADDGIHLHWPNPYTRGRPWRGEAPGVKENDNYTKQVAETKEFLINAKAYSQDSPKEVNLPFKATEGLFTGNQRLFVYASEEKAILDAINTLKPLGIAHIVLVGAKDAYKVTSFLKSNEIPVLLGTTHDLPSRDDADYDLPYKLPKLLLDAGLLVGVGNMGASNFANRNMGFYAGQVAGQGMDKEQALQLITSNTAQILGIDKQYGSLAVGKSATFFISEGDALDMRGNQLTHAFIDGRQVSLETHQTELWKRYSGKYSGQR